jgi:hypothetical protein
VRYFVSVSLPQYSDHRPLIGTRRRYARLVRTSAVAFAVVIGCACGPVPSVEQPTPTSLVSATVSASPTPQPSATVTPIPSPTATPEPTPRTTRVIGGIEFAVVPSPADLKIDTAISRDDETTIVATVAADVDAVQREFDRSFSSRPVVYVFATNETYALGLQRLFGYSTATATFVADNSVSFFEPSLLAIAANWQAIGDRRPIAAIRHELTHRITLDACAPRCDLVPAWLNEGEARLQEALVPGGDWRLVRVRYEAASMAATETLIPLNTLVSQLSWNALTDWAGYYKYQEAARATELLRADIGAAPIARLYERIRRGENVAQAYATLTGRSFADFVIELPARMREGVSSTPGMVTIPATPEGVGPSYLLYGFGPSSTVIVTITGTRSTETWPLTVSPFGAAFDGIAPERARGAYTISVQYGETMLTAKLTKTTAGARGDLR